MFGSARPPIAERDAVRRTRHDRTATVALAALAAATAVAWIGLVTFEPRMGFIASLVGWTLMMAAMMLPSIAPLVLLYRGSRLGLVVGYLAVWGAIGVLPTLAMVRDLSLAPAIVLALAGLYELSPLKTACLRRCQNAAAFLMERYRSGPVRLGVEHGLWCLGCCVGLMAVLVLAAAMHLIWAVAIAIVVFVQKVLVRGEVSARLLGAMLLVSAVVVTLTG